MPVAISLATLIPGVPLLSSGRLLRSPLEWKGIRECKKEVLGAENWRDWLMEHYALRYEVSTNVEKYDRAFREDKRKKTPLDCHRRFTSVHTTFTVISFLISTICGIDV